MDTNTPVNASPSNPPRHWIGPEELEPGYWSRPEVKEQRGQEFYVKPIELIDHIDKTDQAGLARREFLTVMGASMAMAGLACARRPVHKIIPYVVKPEEVTPGESTWYATTWKDGGQTAGVLAKVREGRPIKLEGNPDDPLSRGALSARGQASLLSLYDTDRMKAPVSRLRADGGRRKETSWKEVDVLVGDRLSIAKGGKVRILTGEVRSESTLRLIKDFLALFSSGQHVSIDVAGLDDVAEGQQVSYGTAVVPNYRLDQADVVVSFGADFLGSWNAPVAQAADWIKTRKLAQQNPGSAKMSKLFTIESMMSVTGANSDQRLPVRPGDEIKVALAVAHELVIVGGHAAPGGAAARNALQGYSAEKVAEECGAEASQIKAIAGALWNARGRSLVLGGGVGARGEAALGLQVAVNFLNSMLENDGKTVDGTNATPSPSSGYRGLGQLVREMRAGEVNVLIIQGVNPVYGMAFAGLGFEEALKKVPFVVTVADRENETALASDVVAAESHFLEAWGDASPRKGLMTIQQPVLHPIHDTRSFEDCLLAWSKSAGHTMNGISGKSGDAHAYLMNYWKEVVFPQAGAAAGFQQWWEGVLRVGVWEAKGTGSVAQAHGSPRPFQGSAVSHWPKAGAPAEGLRLSLYASVAMGDGRDANNPWLQELPDPVTSITWDNAVHLGVAAAKKLGVEQNDVVAVTVGDRAVELPVNIQPGLHPMTVASAIGYGRRAAGKVGDGAGIDLYPLVQWKQDRPVFAGLPVSLRKTGRVYRLASTQWHFATEERPVLSDVTLGQFRKNPGTMSHTDPELKLEKVPTLWSTHEYKGYRWGMAIDLTSCIGCNACMVGCQAENNIPVVGRQQVRNSRQMHWIKIDRYYSGNPENPDVVFQPMLCQHCENAPCETVCPVLATVHDDEGLNVQVYNRCVGTRYCQNNCPYKVRRFNFFDHWKAYEGTMNLAWNPDVTVRTRGIMEKCTFCVQRIREAKENAKDVNERVKDGDFKTACQQTCPTEAILFGDLNDPSSRVSKMKKSPQAFRVLEILGTQPAVSYLSKVRNKGTSANEAHPG